MKSSLGGQGLGEGSGSASTVSARTCLALGSSPRWQCPLPSHRDALPSQHPPPVALLVSSLVPGKRPIPLPMCATD
jgi:hypothetical protein